MSYTSRNAIPGTAKRSWHNSHRGCNHNGHKCPWCVSNLTHRGQADLQAAKAEQEAFDKDLGHVAYGSFAEAAWLEQQWAVEDYQAYFQAYVWGVETDAAEVGDGRWLFTQEWEQKVAAHEWEMNAAEAMDSALYDRDQYTNASVWEGRQESEFAKFAWRFYHWLGNNPRPEGALDYTRLLRGAWKNFWDREEEWLRGR